MSYTLNGTVEFIAPLFIREDGYWKNHMLPYLEAEGWKVIVVDCAGVKTTLDFAYRLVESIESVYAIPDDFNLRWASEDACLINWFDMRQGLFVLYKNFEDLFVMDDEDVSLCVNIIEQMDTRYTVRPIHGSGLYQVLFGWGFEISQESLPRVKEFFEGKVVFAMDGVEYPWSRVERFKKVFFLRVFLIRCMRMVRSGLMILMSTPRAHPTPAGTANSVLSNQEVKIIWVSTKTNQMIRSSLLSTSPKTRC